MRQSVDIGPCHHVAWPLNAPTYVLHYESRYSIFCSGGIYTFIARRHGPMIAHKRNRQLMFYMLSGLFVLYRSGTILLTWTPSQSAHALRSTIQRYDFRSKKTYAFRRAIHRVRKMGTRQEDVTMGNLRCPQEEQCGPSTCRRKEVSGEHLS